MTASPSISYKNNLRKSFRDFFLQENHTLVASSPLVPEDSTLLFTNSGMVQFKDYFAGKLESPHKKAVTIQKCVRAGGKHNDLDNVGYTNRHHTFFEMLGNFSFGDYFKEEAISYAWNFLTKEIGIDKSKLYVTVYHTDEEAHNIWQKHIAKERIIKISTSDNFWQVGNVGPCGPCSEIFYDYGDKVFGSLPGTENQDGARFTEIWNLVFMQNYIHEDGKITDLPKKNIDTGMGFERLVSVLEGTVDNYSTSLFKNLIKDISDITNINASQNIFSANGNTSILSNNDITLRILADHIRSISFLIADGVLPSNEGRGYVLRRIIRRTLKSAYFCGVKSSFLPKMANLLISQMGGEYNELIRAKELIQSQIQNEEEKFMELLPKGIKVLEDGMLKNVKNGTLNGEFAFKLYDTYGFPIDITLEIAKKHGVNKIDEESFEKEMQTQQNRSKTSWKGTHHDDMESLKKDISKLPKTEFVGYGQTKCNAKVLYSKNGYTVFDKTPFYAESGGQVADTGLAGFANILDVQNIDGIFVHKLNQDLFLEDVDLIVDEERRNKISANHTATHLLHYVLRKKYGNSLVQKGSLVKDLGFRFDFSHNKPISLEELHEIEVEVNNMVIQNFVISTEICTKNEAISKGAMALFGEKYQENVRVVTAGVSVELCGGVHAKATGDIGFFKIISQESVASGVRRIEAKTGIEAIMYVQNFETESSEIKSKFKSSSSIMDIISHKDDEVKNLKKEISSINEKLINFIPFQEAKINNYVLSYKILNGFTGDIAKIAKNFDGENVGIFNQNQENFTFCITGKNAKDIANALKEKISIKFGGNDNFISGGGNGIIKL